MENSTMSMKEKVMNMMTMKMEELVSECEQAKLKFADIMLDDNADYRCKDSRRLKCTNIEAQMDLLQSMMDKISNMTCEVMLPPMARIFLVLKYSINLSGLLFVSIHLHKILI